jgi:hypothetical protein
MAVVYRTPGPWGPGLGENLSETQLDNNFWQLVQDVQAKAVQGVGISNFIVSGNSFTVLLTDHTLLGPYPLPIAQINFRGEWAPNIGYLANDLITHSGSTYMVLISHTSASVFDPGANDGFGHDFYGLLLQNPSLIIPAGGAAGAFFRKVTGADYAFAWETAALNDLSDVTISAPIFGEALVFSSGGWVNTPLEGLPPGGIDGDILTQSSGGVAAWEPPNINVLLNFPVLGQALVYDGLEWINSSVIDLPFHDIGSFSGSFILDVRTPQTIRFTMINNTTISGFNWPVSSGQIVRRVIEVINIGNYTLTWPATSKWPGGNKPTQTFAATDVYILFSFDGGATVYGNIVGQNYA